MLRDSAHYELYGLLLFCTLAILPIVPAITLLARLVRGRYPPAGRAPLLRGFSASVIAAVVVYAGVCVEAYVIEPNRPVLTTLSVPGAASGLRILHLSDLHLERTPQRRDAWLLTQLERLQPDLIVLTGDTHQLDNDDPATLRPVLARLRAPLGVYAVVGADDERLLGEAAPAIDVLVNEARIVTHGGSTIGIAGLIAVGNRGPLYAAVGETDFSIALNHTPDLAEEAAAAGIDLYLCGHTHGGQVRVPGWGAIITNSSTGKRYEAGRYRLDRTTVYTSRGFGLEPPPAPQVRFFCRPEIILLRVGKPQT